MNLQLKQLTKTLATAALLLVGLCAHADFPEGKHSIQGTLGFSEGGNFAIGFDYEFGMDRTFGFGGYLRMADEDREAGTNTTPGVNQDGYKAMGAFIRPHFNRQNWDLYFSPGFGIIMVDPATPGYDDETLLGPSLSFGVMYEFNSNFALGMESFDAAGWFGEDHYTETIFSQISLKARYIF